jgi:hypothetical protein
MPEILLLSFFFLCSKDSEGMLDLLDREIPIERVCWVILPIEVDNVLLRIGDWRWKGLSCPDKRVFIHLRGRGGCNK